MRLTRWMGFSILFAAAGCLGVAGCGSSGSSCADNNACGSGGAAGASGSGGSSANGGTSGNAGTDGGAGTSGSDAGEAGDANCDPNGDPTSEACLVADAYAVFVNGTATTDGNGTKSSPYQTIGEAVTQANGKLVLVCDTTYDEQVKLTAGVKIYGGFSCAGWSPEANRAVVAPSAKGYALDVEKVNDPVVIEDMEFDAQNGAQPGENSIAAFVNGSSNVALDGVKLVAGKGATGANGTLTKLSYPSQSDLNGNNAATIAGGAPKQCTCPAGDTTTGGAGGNAPTPQDGNPGLPDLGGGQAGQAGSACNSGGGGSDGNPATAQPAASGASTSGTLDASGWTPSSGADGHPGGPGQGGGGGASSASGGGGGGGCGGCGGAGGPGGGGGGASVALLVFNSTVSVDAQSVLVTGNAGDGGSGAAGQTRQTTTGFAGNGTTGGCQGGNGGAGADGEAGGGGAGGVSVAVVWKGAAAPKVDSGVTITLGAKGSAGVGGKAGSNDGIDGVSRDELQVM
jgi:hypothetical protein